MSEANEKTTIGFAERDSVVCHVLAGIERPDLYHNKMTHVRCVHNFLLDSERRAEQIRKEGKYRGVFLLKQMFSFQQVCR